MDGRGAALLLRPPRLVDDVLRALLAAVATFGRRGTVEGGKNAEPQQPGRGDAAVRGARAR